MSAWWWCHIVAKGWHALNEGGDLSIWTNHFRARAELYISPLYNNQQKPLTILQVTWTFETKYLKFTGGNLRVSLF